MKLRDLPGVLDRTQKARWFKIAATVALVVLIGGGFGWYAVAAASGRLGGAEEVLQRITEGAGESAEADAGLRIARSILRDASTITGMGVAAAAVGAVAIVTVWLGLGLTYLLLALIAGLVALPLSLFGPTEVYARLILGVVALSASFTVLMQALRVLLSGSGPVVGVARNLLTEAVRMKISLVFIVLLILGLALLPGILDDDQPLRYRVQSFLQYATSGSFWVLAILTISFGIASVTSEQRDKIIWQTVTKPVAAWQYLLGKWIGLVGLNAVLLVVCASGIFLFVEYLRAQPAVGEVEAYIAEGGGMTEDRFILETRVLTARESRFMELPAELEIDHPQFRERVEDYIRRERLTNPEFATTPEDFAEVIGDLHESAVRGYRTIPPGEGRNYRVTGLQDAVEGDKPINLAIRVDAQGNRPDLLYDLTFVFPSAEDLTPITKKVGLGFIHNTPLKPEVIGPDGVLEVDIYNGRLAMTSAGGWVVQPNPAAASIPDNGLEVSYEAGSYQANFFRIMFVLWVKLAFLAMVAIFASTFLSFPVACLVAFGVFFAAEASTFLVDAADAYGTTGQRGEFLWYKWLTTSVTESVGGLFSVYGEMRPVRRLVTGRLMPWGSVSLGAFVLAAITVLLYGLSVLIFRRRELATYSGQ